MRTVQLIKGIHSSALGFGCASVMGLVDAKKSRRAIECALDCGITHFDLARSYGYGEAEEFVGKIMKNRRDKVILASKFGICANWKANVLRPMKPLIRFADKSFKEKPSDNMVKVRSGSKVGDMFHKRISIQKKEMRISLEQSLRALNTDYLDYYFVHEPLESIANIEELTEAAQLLIKEGKIRAWGLAFMKTQEKLHEQYLNRFDVLQFDNSPGSPTYESMLEKRGVKPNVIFSPLRGAGKEIKPNQIFKKIFEDFPNSVVLCSMFSEEHIKENVKFVL
jgi:aryl-alcohol dehydrogenase-like predicted oxidoreductase